ncbi:Hypothetical Protein FCC1311_102602 [Hondaea fermentalgiana]|uniref:Uncharacterized protein n=1 Tax=Hondaea fermentalgiana TaxID=2315210 RepID=A0A2R5GT42_9STRA|nr:Hypothetical Protein FCC1311_102602 [Hondaea fermentalgiana]|eukprot:GBG34037.1 Hypothetical Protein FCC1311_102602 [Hondaea fermentalgiana]
MSDDRVETEATNSEPRAANFVASAAEAINTSREARQRSEEKRGALYEEFGEDTVRGWVGEHQALLAAGVLGGEQDEQKVVKEDDGFDAYGERILETLSDVELPAELPWPAEGNCFELVVAETAAWDSANPLGLVLLPATSASSSRAEMRAVRAADDHDTQEIEVSFGTDASIRMGLSSELTLRVEARGADHDLVACVPSSYMTRLVGRQSEPSLNEGEGRRILLSGPSDLRVSFRVIQLSDARIAWQVADAAAPSSSSSSSSSS